MTGRWEKVGLNGSLTALAPVTVGDSPIALMRSKSDVLYVIHGNDQDLYAYKIVATGDLTALAGSPLNNGLTVTSTITFSSSSPSFMLY